MESRPSVVRSAVALTAAQIVTPILQAVQLVVVTRTIGPRDLGDWVLPAVVIAAESTLLELGLNAVLARRPLDDDVALARRWAIVATVAHVTVVVLAVVLGASWSGLVAATTPVATLAAVAAVGRARLAHADMLGRVGRIELAATAAGTAVTCLWAAGGAGTWALAVGAVTRALVLMILVRDIERHPSAGTTAGPRGAHLILLTYAFLFVAGNVDYAIGAHLLTRAELGTYFVAFNIAMVPLGRVGLAVNRSIVSRQDGRPASENALLLAGSLAVGVSAAALIAAAAPVVPSLLGDRWRAVVDPVRILAIAGAAGLVTSALRGIVIGVAHDRRAAATSAGAAAITVASVLILRPDDPTGLATAVAGASVIGTAAWAAVVLNVR